MEKSLKIIFCSILLFSFLDCFSSSESVTPLSESLKEEDITEEITIHYTYKSHVYMGTEGNFYLNTDYYDSKAIFNSSDIEDNSEFATTIYNYYSNYETTCRLWKPSNENLKIFCKVEKASRIFSIYDSYLNSGSFIYKSYRVNIERPSSNYNFSLYQISDLPIIYSEAQVINIEEGKNLYELRFKYKEYNNQLLLLYYNGAYKYLGNCSDKLKDNYLICKLEKEEIEEILRTNIQIFNIYSYNSNIDFGKYKIEIIQNITIIHNIPQKKDIYVGITKLLEKDNNYLGFIIYETNITNISNLESDFFYIETSSLNSKCYFKKNIKDPLILLCLSQETRYSINYLGQINDEIVLNNSNIKYNFRIQPGINMEYFTFYKYASKGISLYPTVLDFNLNETFTIYYIMDYSSYTTKITLNFDSNNLTCSQINRLIISCNIDRKYFENKKSGYYDTYYQTDKIKIYSKFYEYSPIQVIIPDDNRIYISISKNIIQTLY